LAAHRKANRTRRSGRQRPTDTDPSGRGARAVKARRCGRQNAWELVHPRCVLHRAEDLEEVQAMLESGEVEIARDELRWLLEGCSDFIQAHRLLGDLALADGELKLARGHFGYAFQIGRSALPLEASSARLPYRLPANQPLLESAKALAWCLHELGKTDQALDVLRELLRWDPDDPLGVQVWLGQWQQEAG
jgi:tetratricopeptide (TPR) repeat protein